MAIDDLQGQLMRAYAEDGKTIVAEAEHVRGQGYTIMIYDGDRATIGHEKLNPERAARVLSRYNRALTTM